MIILLVIIDQLLKLYISNIKPNFDVIGSFLRIHYTQNTGTIFGLFENSNLFFIVLAVALCVIIALYVKKNVKRKSLQEKGFMLILAGGIGNLIDRIFRGFVVDFISLKWVGIFNFADMCIVIGVGLIIIFELMESLKNGKASKKSDFNV